MEGKEDPNMSEELKNNATPEVGAEEPVTEEKEAIVEETEAVQTPEVETAEQQEPEEVKAPEEAKASEKAEEPKEAKKEKKKEKSGFAKVLDAIRGVLEDEEIDDDATIMAEETLETSPDATATAGKPGLRGFFKTVFGNRLVNRLIVFLIAVAMLVMSFVPFVTYQVQTADGMIHTVEYSGVDTVQITMFSMVARGTVGEMDTATYEQALKDISDPEAKAALIRQMTIGSATYAQKGAHITSLIAAALFTLYTLFCTIFVFMAAVNLITEFFTGKKTRHRVKRFASDGLLCFIIGLLPVVCFAMIQACELCSSVGVLSIVKPIGGAHLSWTAILTLVLAGVAGVLSALSHSLGILRESRRYFDRRRIKHLLSIALIAVILLATALPCLQIRVIDIASGKEMALGVSLWDIREMTANEWMTYANAPERINQEYISALGAMPEVAEYEGERFVHTMLIPANVRIMFTLFAFMEFVTLALLVFAGIWLFGILRRGFFGKKRRFMINLFRILTLICVCVEFLFVLYIKSALDLCLRGELMYVTRFNVGSGMLLMFLCALLGTVLRLREKRAIVYADEEYDNAEVSYAPYVLEDGAKTKKAKKEKKEKKGKKDQVEEAEPEEPVEAESEEEAPAKNTKFCIFCGKEIADDSLFCTHCGQKQE